MAGDALDGRIMVLPATDLTNANVRTIADTAATPPRWRDDIVQDTRNVDEVWTPALVMAEGNKPALPAVADDDNISQAPSHGLVPAWSGKAGRAPEQSVDLFWRRVGEEIGTDSSLSTSCIHDPCAAVLDDWSRNNLPIGLAHSGEALV